MSLSGGQNSYPNSLTLERNLLTVAYEIQGLLAYGARFLTLTALTVATWKTPN